MAVRQKSRAKPLVIVFLSIACLAMIAFGILLFLPSSSGGLGAIPTGFQIEGLDPSAKTGTLPGAPKDEASPGEDLFSFRINAAPVFQSDGTNGKIQVQNPAFNSYLMVLELAVNGELIYQSGYIAPNQYIESIDLQKSLAEGNHTATAYLNAVDPISMEWVGVLEHPLTITIK